MAVLATAPHYTLEQGPCARHVLLDGRTLRGGPGRFCIEQVLPVEFAEGAFVALRVAAPHRFEARVRSRVFVYRVEGERLVPRFLGSGFSAREVTGLVALENALGVQTLTSAGVHETLSCTFDGFPLICAVPLARDDMPAPVAVDAGTP